MATRKLLAARANATTKHVASLYPWHFGGSLSCDGPVIGVDKLSGGSPWTFDPFELIGAELASNPNVIVAGEPGMGKSSIGKASAWWLVGAFGYRLAAIDVKGEYARLGQLLGCEVLAMHPGGTSHVNPMTTDGTREGDTERLRFVAALASILVGRSLNSLEHTFLDEAVRTVAATEPVPLLRHVAAVFNDPSANIVADLQTPRDTLLDRTSDVRFALRRLVTGSLAGMFDAERT